MGNVKLVGNLLVKRMVASKVFVACTEELLTEPTRSTLEPLACLLTTAGPEFDDPSWSYHTAIKTVYARCSKLAKDQSLPKRTRFLLQDVLDLRAAGWENKKMATKRPEGPKKLDDVAAEAKKD